MPAHTPFDASELSRLDTSHFVHPSTPIQQHLQDGPALVTGADGVFIDFSDGHSRLDGVAGLWLCNVGYGRKELAEVAYQQMLNLAYFPTFFGYTNQPTVELASLVSNLTPGDLNHVFFSLGGSEANEIAFKVARSYHHVTGNPQKKTIISRRLGYHGVTFGAISASGLNPMRDGLQPVVPGFMQIEPPYCFRCPFGLEYPECKLMCADDLERAIVREGAQNVAAFLAEPVVGVGGIIIPPEGYYERVREICDKYNVLFIADEVITGFGRTGKMFGIENWDALPDIMVMAKGITSGYLPLGATALRDHVFEALANAPGVAVSGFTYSGHPTISAVALKNIAILQNENMAENALEQGAYLKQRLLDLNNPYIGEVRGIGLMFGIEIVRDAATRESFDPAVNIGYRVQRAAFKRNLLCRGLQSHVVALSPPLCITRDEVDFLVDALDPAIYEAVETVAD